MFTFFHGCGIPPVTLTCPPGGGAQAQTILGPTAYLGCGQGGAQAQTIGITGWYGCRPTVPGSCFGPTGTQGCTVVGPTGTQGCGQGGAQAQTGITITTTLIPTAIQCITKGAHAQNVGPTGSYATVCGPTQVPGCDNHNVSPTGSYATVCGPTQVPGCDSPIKTWFQGCGVPPVTLTCPQEGGAQAQTQHLTGTNGCTMICNNTANCPGDAQAQTLGPTAYQGCGGTMATVCTQIGCGPTHLLGCTGYQGCHQPQTLPTVCTQVGCNDGGGAAGAQIPSIPVADCIPTRSCTGAWPVC